MNTQVTRAGRAKGYIEYQQEDRNDIFYTF